jgi:hypothetical protein
MSANLLDGLTPKLNNRTEAESDGTWHHAARTKVDMHDDWLTWELPGQAALEANQTYHVGLSVRGASANAASLRATIGYEDAAGNHNWVNSGALAIGTSWGRDESTITVPSGMKPFAFYVAAYGVCPETWMAAPTLSLGSPVTLASSAHTPYATQDHLQTNYATNSALEQTSTEIQASVSDSLTQAKTYTDGQVETEVTNRNAAITESANEIKSEVSETYATQDNLAAANSAITQNANAISSEVTARETTDSTVSTLSTKVTQNADNITTEISDRKTAISDLQSSSLSTVAVYYALSTSSTTAPTDGWSTTAPTWVNGEYMWQKTVTTKADGTTATSDPTCISGATGATGATGTGVSSSAVTYQLSTSGTTAPTGTWSSTVPTLVKGEYLWTRTVITYTNSTTTTLYSTSYIARDGNDGADGVAGKDGVGISSTTITYASSTSGTTAPTSGWSSTIPTVAAGSYLWQKTVWIYTDSTTETGYNVAKQGDTGATGATGATGTGVSSIKPQYYLSTSSTTQAGGSWSDTCPAWVVGEYYWTRSYITWSDGTTTTTTPVLDDASNTANQTASDAKDTATTLSTLIRESSSGVDVGKSSDGTAYSTSVARVGSDGAFHILTSALVEVAKYAGTLIELGKNSTSAIIKFCGGLGEMGLLTDPETTFSPSFGLHSDSEPITLLYSHTVSDSDFESGLNHTAGSFPTGTKIDSSVAAGPANDYGGGEAAIMSSAVAPDGKHRAWGSVNLLSGFSDSTGTAIPSTDAPRMSVSGGTSDGSTTSSFGGEYPLDRVATAIQPVVLYNGGASLNYNTAPGSGTKGTVKLSETAANFSKLKIFYRTDDNAYGSYEVPSPNGKRVGLSSNWSTGASMWYKSRAIEINGTSITTVEYGNVNSDGSTFSHSNVISIVRVEGIR